MVVGATADAVGEGVAVVAAGAVVVAVVGATPPLGAGTALTVARGSGSRPTHAGRCQITTAIPQAVKSMSIAAKATSFCRAEGPRARTTTVGVLGRRGLIGRSGIRTVMCAT